MAKKIKSNQILETEIVSWRRSFRSQRNPKLNSSEIISWKPISIFSVKRNALEQKQIGNLIKIGNCVFWYLVEDNMIHCWWPEHYWTPLTWVNLNCVKHVNKQGLTTESSCSNEYTQWNRKMRWTERTNDFSHLELSKKTAV